jgi:hypothetical protein
MSLFLPNVDGSVLAAGESVIIVEIVVQQLSLSAQDSWPTPFTFSPSKLFLYLAWTGQKSTIVIIVKKRSVNVRGISQNFFLFRQAPQPAPDALEELAQEHPKLTLQHFPGIRK